MAKQARSPKRIVAYFSMEIALENAMPSYSGGLGVLAGDTVRAAADIKLPMVAVSLSADSIAVRPGIAEWLGDVIRAVAVEGFAAGGGMSLALACVGGLTARLESLRYRVAAAGASVGITSTVEVAAPPGAAVDPSALVDRSA